VNEQLGLVARVPPGLAAEIGGPTTVMFSRTAPSPVVIGVELSDQIASMDTVDEVHGAVAGEFRRVLGAHELDYVRGRDVSFEIGSGIEREWRVRDSSAGLKAIVLYPCARARAAWCCGPCGRSRVAPASSTGGWAPCAVPSSRSLLSAPI
jgi:hypothetical protein